MNLIRGKSIVKRLWLPKSEANFWTRWSVKRSHLREKKRFCEACLQSAAPAPAATRPRFVSQNCIALFYRTLIKMFRIESLVVMFTIVSFLFNGLFRSWLALANYECGDRCLTERQLTTSFENLYSPFSTFIRFTRCPKRFYSLNPLSLVSLCILCYHLQFFLCW